MSGKAAGARLAQHILFIAIVAMVACRPAIAGPSGVNRSGFPGGSIP